MTIKKLLSLLLCAAMLLSLVSVAAAEGVPENGVVRVYLWGDPDEAELAAIAYTEETYKIKVDWSVVAWEALDQQVVNDINAGEAPDLLTMHAQNFPRVAVQKLVMPVSQLNQELYNNAVLATSAAGARASFTYAGESYAAGGYVDPVFIFYNKTMFDDYGMETPLELYEAGEWNWDTFRQSALDIMDYDEEGNPTVWGFESWEYDMWVLANGADFVIYEANGNITPNLNDAKVINALQFYQDGYYKDKFMKPDGNVTHTTDFTTGKCAMIADGLYRILDFQGVMKDEWDFVPVPVGPDNPEGLLPGTVNGWAICAGAKNPDGALMYLIGRAEYDEMTKDTPAGAVAYLDDAQRARYDLYANGEMAAIIHNSSLQGIGNVTNLQWGWWDQVRDGTPVVTANDSFAPVLQAEIEVTLADVVAKTLTKEAFTGLPVIDFEDETADFMRNDCADGSAWGSTTFEVVDDGIEGRSLHIVPNGEEWQLAARTDSDKWFFPGYDHNYKFTFDYKMLTDMGDGGYFNVCLRPTADIANGNAYGWEVSPNMAAGDEGTFEFTVYIGDDVGPMSLVISGYLNGEMLIDNVTITEVE